MSEITKCGFVGLIGRPNVGKSTLLNKILGEKVSIISSKPQTTRHRILGIDTQDDAQVIYIDTPGIHQAQKKAINRMMNRTALNTLEGTDIILFIVDANRWTDEDEYVLRALKNVNAPIVLVINKVDMIGDKNRLLPTIDTLSEKHDFAAVFPISAKRGDNLVSLQEFILKHLPSGTALYDEDQLTDRGLQFMVSEFVREKIFIYCQQELPYSTNVVVEAIAHDDDIVRIAALIYVEREGQKKIVIGKSGINLKRVGSEARRDIEALLEKKVFLQLWVKVKESWTDDEQLLRNLGYSDE